LLLPVFEPCCDVNLLPCKGINAREIQTGGDVRRHTESSFPVFRLCNRLTDFPLITKGIEEKENTVPVVFIDRFGQNVEFLATDEVIHACQVVDLQNQRDAYSTVDRSTAPDGFGSPVTLIV